jgi:hypothetical protein
LIGKTSYSRVESYEVFHEYNDMGGELVLHKKLGRELTQGDGIVFVIFD